MNVSILEALLVAEVSPCAVVKGIQLLWMRNSYLCPECDRRVEKDEPACPRCGNDLTVGYPP